MNPKSVLHIDDDSNDALLLQHACAKAEAGFQLVSVEDGEHAMAYLKGEGEFADRNKFPLPALALLDLKMPRLGGFDVLQWIRAQKNILRLPVIVLTSSRHASDMEQAYALRANSYLVKPIGFDDLVELIRTIDRYWIKTNEPPQLSEAEK